MSSWGGRKVPRLRALVIHTYGTTCHLCGKPINGTVSIDHLIPRSRGGNDSIENLRPSHYRCNLRKGNRLPRRHTQLATPTDW